MFAGGCTLAAAEAVTGAALEIVESLVAKNLAVGERLPDGKRRLTMLETIRAFSRTRLERRGDTDAVRRRHCEYYVALAERAQPELERTASPALLAELDRELDNMRTAFAWALEHQPALALRLATAASIYWYLSLIQGEAAEWLAAALALPSQSVPVAIRAAALRQHGFHLAKPGTIEQAERATRASIELCRTSNDVSGWARSTNVLSRVRANASRIQEAYECARQALELADAAHDEQSRVWALETMALMAPSLPEALRLGDQAAATYRAAGNQRSLAALETSLVYSALVHDDDAAAHALSLCALDAARAYADPFVLACAHGNAGLAALFTGRPKPARQEFARGLRLGRGHGFESRFAGLLFEAISGLAAVAAAEGHDRTAATLSGGADAATAERHDPAIARRLDERFLALARGRLGEQAWLEAYAAGASLDPDRTIEAALRGGRLHIVA